MQRRDDREAHVARQVFGRLRVVFEPEGRLVPRDTPISLLHKLRTAETDPPT